MILRYFNNFFKISNFWFLNIIFDLVYIIAEFRVFWNFGNKNDKFYLYKKFFNNFYTRSKLIFSQIYYFKIKIKIKRKKKKILKKEKKDESFLAIP